MNIIVHIERLYRERGGTPEAGHPGVSALEHALQCAQLAEWGELAPALVGAALLHDIGHLVCDDGSSSAGAHEVRGAAFLADHFGPEVVEPVRLHVAAKRYLVTVDPGYTQALSDASRLALPRQGGPMSRDELRRFESLPHALDAVTLRRLDDVAGQPGRTTPPLHHYLPLLERLHHAARVPATGAARRSAA